MTPFRVTRHSHWVIAVLILTFGGGATASGANPIQQRGSAPAPKPAPPLDADAKTIDGFMQRVKTYVALHQKYENTLPKLSKDATPQQIDKNQRALLELIAQARRGAVRGAIFTPEMETYARNMLKKVFSAPDGAALRASVLDENPMGVKFGVNQRYPDEVPLATMPPEVLAALPKLPEELEYRFISDRLILLDPHAHLVVDYIDHALPPVAPTRGGR